MVHQEPADKVMRISDTVTRDLIGSQKQTRIFECTTCQNNGVCLHFGAPAITGAYLERFDPRSILAGVDLRNVGMHQQSYIGRVHSGDRPRKAGGLERIALVS